MAAVQTRETSPLDLPLIITTFPDHAARVKRQHTKTLRQLEPAIRAATAPEKSALPWLKLAEFGDVVTPRGSLRHNANVGWIFGIEGDYDAGVMSPDDAATLLTAAGIAALIYTSPSHAPDRPRWRVLCPLSEFMIPNARAELVGRVNAVLGGVLARESFTLSQSFYYGRVGDNPAHRVILAEGRAIDLCDEIEPVYPPKTEPVRIDLPPAGAPDEHATAVLARAVALFESTEGDRHQRILAGTTALAPHVLAGAISEGDVIAAIAGAVAESGREPNDDEIESALAGALKTARPYREPVSGEFGEAPGYDPATEPLEIPELTEDAAALAFAERYRRRFAYDHTEKQWFRFTDGLGWEADDNGAVARAVRDFIRNARIQADGENKGAARIAFAGAVQRGCQDDKHMAVTRASWDTDSLTLGVPGGFVDLRTGEFHAASSARLIRRRASVAPAPTGAVAPVWLRFLHDATRGDADLQAWLQRLAGYALTGDVSEEIIAFAYGTGGNGKGVFVRTLATILGDYAYQAPAELFKADSRVNREYQLARLDGVRLMLASETEKGAVLAESLVKELTGNEGAINARNPYGRPFQFRSQAKVLIVGNHAPRLQDRSAAIERRMRVVPFLHTPQTVDPALKDKLAAEYPAILRWLIDGCRSWQQDRLQTCAAISRASSAYFAEQDPATQWADGRCIMEPDARGSASALLADYNVWARTQGRGAADSMTFKEMLLRLPGVTWQRTKKGRIFFGIRLPSEPSFTDLT